MKKIYKYELTGTVNNLVMPHDAMPLTVDVDKKTGVICLWVMFNIANEHIPQSRIYHIVGTGQAFDPTDDLVYMATVQQDDYVWHIFEEM